MNNYARYTKAEIIGFLERAESEQRQTREKLWEVQRELQTLKDKGALKLDKAREQVRDTVGPLIEANSVALEYFWQRLELEASFGDLPQGAYELIRDTWEQAEAEQAASNLESFI